MKPRKSKFLTALLALVGGSFGLHRFYLGEFQIGIMFIFIMIAFGSIKLPISTILGFIEFFRFLTMGQSEFDRKYNKQALPAQAKQRSPLQQQPQAQPSKTFSKRENPYRKSGLKKFDEFDIEGAVSDLEESLKIEPNEKEIFFKLASAYSLLEKADESVNYLHLAIQNGYKDFNTINSSQDLAFLRISKQYQDYKEKGYNQAPSQAKQPESQEPKQDVREGDLLLAQLKKLSELRQRGLLSEHDYVKEKEKIIQAR